MSTSKRRAVDDVSEQGDALSLSGAPSPQHAVRTRGNCPCPMMSCACTGEFHSSTPPTAPKPEQICKAQKTTKASDVEQDMDQERVDIVHTTRTVRVRPANSLLRRALLSS